MAAEADRMREALCTIALAPSCSSIEWAALTAFVALTGEDMPDGIAERERVIGR